MSSSAPFSLRRALIGSAGGFAIFLLVAFAAGTKFCGGDASNGALGALLTVFEDWPVTVGFAVAGGFCASQTKISALRSPWMFGLVAVILIAIAALITKPLGGPCTPP
jgi:hypothetical protein